MEDRHKRKKRLSSIGEEVNNKSMMTPRKMVKTIDEDKMVGRRVIKEELRIKGEIDKIVIIAHKRRSNEEIIGVTIVDERVISLEIANSPA